MAQTQSYSDTDTIANVEVLYNSSAPTLSSIIEQDRETALRDLRTDDCYFKPLKNAQGPYSLTLSIQDNRLVIEMENAKGEPIPMLVLSLKPYKRLIQDYFMIVRSYDEAIKIGQHARIEAIDMGRRGIHNEGANMLMERLDDKIDMDINTARRMFTLICALQESKALLWR